jgi:hypothetical protein
VGQNAFPQIASRVERMKRTQLIKHLIADVAMLLREEWQAQHLPKRNSQDSITRHPEIVNELAKNCLDLHIPFKM